MSFRLSIRLNVFTSPDRSIRFVFLSPRYNNKSLTWKTHARCIPNSLIDRRYLLRRKAPPETEFITLFQAVVYFVLYDRFMKNQTPSAYASDTDWICDFFCNKVAQSKVFRNIVNRARAWRGAHLIKLVEKHICSARERYEYEPHHQ